VPAVVGTFELLSGTPKRYVKIGESGKKREQAFCGNCGTHLYSAPPGLVSRVVALRVGSIRQRDQLIPKDQYWHRSSQKWLQDLSSITRTEKQPIFDPKGGFGIRPSTERIRARGDAVGRARPDKLGARICPLMACSGPQVPLTRCRLVHPKRTCEGGQSTSGQSPASVVARAATSPDCSRFSGST
jgi:hypothetical protein